MKHQKVFFKSLVIIVLLLIAMPSTTCMAQRSAGRHYDKELFGKSRKGKAFDDKIKGRSASEKAKKEQARKEDARVKAADRTMNDNRQRHFKIQSSATQERMINNKKSTEVKYKAKQQKQKKEQTKPKKRNYKKP